MEEFFRDVLIEHHKEMGKIIDSMKESGSIKTNGSVEQKKRLDELINQLLRISINHLGDGIDPNKEFDDIVADLSKVYRQILMESGLIKTEVKVICIPDKVLKQMYERAHSLLFSRLEHPPHADEISKKVIVEEFKCILEDAGLYNKEE